MAKKKLKHWKTNLEYEVITLNKEQAQEILDNHNNMNRNLLKNTCSTYKDQINDGSFVPNGQGEVVSFDKNGELLNGQHRIKAFIDSDYDLMDFLFVRNCRTEDFATFDGGRNRNPSQILGISGCKKPAIGATIIRTIQAYKEDRFYKRPDAFCLSGRKSRSFLKNSLNENYLQHKDMYDSIIEHFSKGVPVGTSFSVAAACAIAFILMDDEFELCYSPDDVYGFLDSFMKRVDTSKYSIISDLLTANGKMLKEKNPRQQAFLIQFDMIAQAWNNRNNGEKRISYKYKNKSFTKLK